MKEVFDNLVSLLKHLAGDDIASLQLFSDGTVIVCVGTNPPDKMTVEEFVARCTVPVYQPFYIDVLPVFIEP